MAEIYVIKCELRTDKQYHICACLHIYEWNHWVQPGQKLGIYINNTNTKRSVTIVFVLLYIFCQCDHYALIMAQCSRGPYN